MDITKFLIDVVDLKAEAHQLFKISLPVESAEITLHRMTSTQRWINFDNTSCLLYPKGAHNIIEKIIHYSEVDYTESDLPLNNNQIIPIVEPLYGFFGGYFSSVGYDNKRLKEDDLFNWFDEIAGQIIHGKVQLDPHMITLPNRLAVAYKDYDFDIDKVQVLDTNRHGISYFISEKFKHLNPGIKNRLWETQISSELSSPYSMIISSTFLKWQRNNKFKNHNPTLIEIFANEYKLYDYFRIKYATDYENRKGG